MNTEIRLFEDYYKIAPNYMPKGDLFKRIENFVTQSKQNNSDILARDIIFLYGETMHLYNQHSDKTRKLGDVAKELLVRKTQDYNSDKINDPDFRVDDKRSNYFPFGDKSYLHMLWTKMLRVKSVASSSKDVNFESLEDSLIDMANYLAFYYSFKLDQ